MEPSDDQELIGVFCPFQSIYTSKFNQKPASKLCNRRLANLAPGSSGELWCVGGKHKKSFYFSITEAGDVKIVETAKKGIISNNG